MAGNADGQSLPAADASGVGVPGCALHTLMPRMPMDDRFLSQMTPVPASLAVPFNTLMPRVPMDAPFLLQMPPVPSSLAVPFNTLMPRVPIDNSSLSQMPPVPAYQAAHHSLPSYYKRLGPGCIRANWRHLCGHYTKRVGSYKLCS